MKCFGFLYQSLSVGWDAHALNGCLLFYPLACKRHKMPCSALGHAPFPGWEELPVSTELAEIGGHMPFRKGNIASDECDVFTDTDGRSP